MTKLGIIHYNLPQFSFPAFLDYCRQTGFAYVELMLADVWNEADPDHDAEAAAENVRGLMDQRGLRVSALAAHNDFIQLDASAIDAQVKRMQRICGLAPILGTDVIRTEGGAPKDEVPASRWIEAMAVCLKRCLEFAEPAGIRLAVDNHGLVTNDADLQLELIQRAGSKFVGANLDTMNYRWAGHPLPEVRRYYEIIAPHVFHTHLKDGTGSRENYKGAVLGRGEIELRHAVKCLKQAGYEGIYCAEYEGRDDPQPIGYRKCLEWMKVNI